MDADSSSSPTNPWPPHTPSIAELRTLLLEFSRQLSVFERTLAKADFPTRRTRCLIGSPSSLEERKTRLEALSVRLRLISEILAAMDNGVALVSAEKQLADLMLTNSLERLRAAIAAESPSTSSPNGAPELPLEPQPPNAGA